MLPKLLGANFMTHSIAKYVVFHLYYGSIYFYFLFFNSIFYSQQDSRVRKTSLIRHPFHCCYEIKRKKNTPYTNIPIVDSIIQGFIQEATAKS
jgi:hypothetical protein